MELDLVRKELNYYDELIKNMINLRMSLIPIVADIKTKNNIPFFQGKREDEIYKNIEAFANQNGMNQNLLKSIYKLIIGNALKMEEDIAKDENKSVIENKDIQIEDIKQDFQRLDNIIQNEIPDILLNIRKNCEKYNLNVNQLATLYYNDKINKKENADV